jgi:hypothetical protein
MTRKSLLIWVILLVFGFSSMPEIGLAKESKQTGKTELTKKKKRGKKNVKKHRTNKKRKGSKNKRSAGKTKYTKKSKYSKKNKYSKRTKKSKKKYSTRTRHKRTYVKRYSPPTNNGTVEYRNYKRNSEGENTQQDIEKIAPQKEIRKEPKKEGE